MDEIHHQWQILRGDGIVKVVVFPIPQSDITHARIAQPQAGNSDKRSHKHNYTHIHNSREMTSFYYWLRVETSIRFHEAYYSTSIEPIHIYI